MYVDHDGDLWVEDRTRISLDEIQQAYESAGFDIEIILHSKDCSTNFSDTVIP